MRATLVTKNITMKPVNDAAKKAKTLKKKSEIQASFGFSISGDWPAGNKASPWFLWVHYYDAHYPYAPPEPFAHRYAKAPYLGEIAYTDKVVGRLASAMSAS